MKTEQRIGRVYIWKSSPPKNILKSNKNANQRGISSWQVRWIPLNKRALQHWRALLKFTRGFSLRLQHAACSETPSLHSKYFREEMENNIAGDERSHQVRAGAKQGYNCFLYFHFPPLSAAMNKVSLPNNKQATGYEPTPVCVWLCCLHGSIFEWQDTRVAQKFVICEVRGRSENRGSQLGLPCFRRHAPCSCLFITLSLKTWRLSGDEVTPPTRCSSFLLRFERGERVTQLCTLWDCGCVVFAGDDFFFLFSWCCLVSYVHLISPTLGFLLLAYSGLRGKKQKKEKQIIP